MKPTKRCYACALAQALMWTSEKASTSLSHFWEGELGVKCMVYLRTLTGMREAASLTIVSKRLGPDGNRRASGSA